MAESDLAVSLAELELAAQLVHRVMPATPQYAWPKLRRRIGCSVWVKHENHTPTGAFKVRGGLVYLDRLTRRLPEARAVVSATRGNHGQSISFAAARTGVTATIYVPVGNSPDQNTAMQSFGATVVEVGRDFDEARGSKGPELRWRKNDKLSEEIARMDVLLETLGTLPADESVASFRLHTNPFFLKLCPRIIFNPDDKGLFPGMYLPLDLWRRLARDPATRGIHGGRFIS